MRSRTGLVNAAELGECVGDIGHSLVVIDMRESRGGLPVVPGSARLDLHGGFGQHRPQQALDYDLPSPEEFASALSRAGASPQSDEQLAEVLHPFIANGHQPITYCQGGIRASLTWFALQVLLGRPAKLYAASWEEWAQRRELPVELPA